MPTPAISSQRASHFESTVSETSTELKRELRFWDSVAINIGIIIGVGIFRVPSEVAKHLTSPAWILAAWVAAGVIAHFGALCYAELASRFPKTGGTYVFLRETYGKLTGFLFGWTEIAILRAGSIAAVSYVFAAYLGKFIPLGAWGEKLAAMSAIFALTFVNLQGLKLGTRVQNVFSVLKVLILVIMSACILWWARKNGILSPGASEISAMPSGGTNSVLALAFAIVPIFWTYGGWHESAFMSGEFHDTKRELPLSLVMSALVVMVLYLMINYAYLTVMTPGEMVNSKAIAADVFDRLLGHAGNAIVSVAVLISAIGALNSTIMAGGRIPFAVAQDYPKFRWAAAIDPKLGAPYRSLQINGVWAAIMVLLGSFEQLLFFSQFAQWLFFALAGIAIFINRRRGDGGKIFQMPGYPIVPIIFTLMAACICFSIVLHSPTGSLIGCLLIGVGAVVYWMVSDKSEKGRVTSGPGPT